MPLLDEAHFNVYCPLCGKGFMVMPAPILIRPSTAGHLDVKFDDVQISHRCDQMKVPRA